ncbi:hypothetical protein WA556_006031 [Blastocystis sp. ATCC 50177/Nand II]
MDGGYMYSGTGEYTSHNDNAGSTSYGGASGSGTPMKPSAPKFIIPIAVSMISRLSTGEEGVFKLFGTTVSTVCICGIISSYRNGTSGSRDYVIHDCTGAINGRYYSNGNTDALNDGYVKVVGQLRVFNSKLSLSIHHMQPIFNANEITDHFLSCISCYLYYKKRSSGSVNTANNAAIAQEAPTGMMGGEMSDLESKIYGLLQGNKQQGGEGVQLADIVNSLKMQGVGEDEVRFTIEQMVSNMTIYEVNPEMYTVQSSV